MSADSYRTIRGEAIAQIVEKKSRFIANLEHVECEEDALDFIERIRHENAQARHNVYAYILKNGRVRYSDDGEPAKTAGIPTYEVLEHENLKDVACVTTRYFGGVLLGTGGLVRAYTQAVQEALKIADIVRICICRDIVVTTDYSLYKSILTVGEQAGARVMDTKFASDVIISFRIINEESYGFVSKLKEVARGNLLIEISDPVDAAI